MARPFFFFQVYTQASCIFFSSNASDAELFPQTQHMLAISESYLRWRREEKQLWPEDWPSFQMKINLENVDSFRQPFTAMLAALRTDMHRFLFQYGVCTLNNHLDKEVQLLLPWSLVSFICSELHKCDFLSWLLLISIFSRILLSFVFYLFQFSGENSLPTNNAHGVMLLLSLDESSASLVSLLHQDRQQPF